MINDYWFINDLNKKGNCYIWEPNWAVLKQLYVHSLFELFEIKISRWSQSAILLNIDIYKLKYENKAKVQKEVLICAIAK